MTDSSTAITATFFLIYFTFKPSFVRPLRSPATFRDYPQEEQEEQEQEEQEQEEQEQEEQEQEGRKENTK